MTLTMIIEGLPPCPRNRSHSIAKRGKAHFMAKTEAGRTYEAAVTQLLQPYRLAADAFTEQFDPAIHCLRATWEFTSPSLMTKDGRVSKTSGDLDSHKVLQDAVMAFVGLDDSLIIDDCRSKGQGDHRTVVRLQICPIPEVGI